MDRWAQLQRIFRWLLVAALINAVGWTCWWVIPRLRNAPPVAKLGLASINETNRTVVVYDDGSYDPEARSAREGGGINNWTIDWGDGQESVFTNGLSSELHQYAEDGSYKIRLTCVDDFGASGVSSTTSVEIGFVTKLGHAAQASQLKAEQDRKIEQEQQQKAEQEQRKAETAKNAVLTAEQMAERTRTAMTAAQSSARTAAEALVKAESESKIALSNAAELERSAKAVELEAEKALEDANKKQQKAQDPPFLANRNKLKQEAEQSTEAARALSERAEQARSDADKAQRAGSDKERLAENARREAAIKKREAENAGIESERAAANLKAAKDSASIARQNAETAQENARLASKQAGQSQSLTELARRDAQIAAEVAKQPALASTNGLTRPQSSAVTSIIRPYYPLPEPLAISLAALLAVAVVYMITRCFRYSIILSSLLGAKQSAQKHLLSKYSGRKRMASKLRLGLEHKYHCSRKDETRGAALTALLELARLRKDETAAHEMLSDALKADSPVLQRIAITELSHAANESMVNLLEGILGSADDPKLRCVALAGVLRYRWREVTRHIRDGNFDKAEALTRQLLTLAPDNQALNAVQDRMPLIRQKAFEQQRTKDEIERHVKQEEARALAAKLAKQAAEAIAHNDCDAAEDLAKRALGQFPQDELARNALRDLPQLRRELSEAEAARQTARRQKEASERRRDAECLLNDQDYEAAGEALLALRALDPIDSWANQNLENLPTLQVEKRRLEEQEAMNEQAKRIRTLRSLAGKKWNSKDFEGAEQAVHELISLEPSEGSHKALVSAIAEARRAELANQLYSQAQQAIREGRIDLADEKLRELLLTEPEASRAKSLSDQLSTLRQMHNDAKGRRLEARRQRLAEGWKRKAHALLTAGKLEEARKAANKFAANSTDGEAIAVILEQIEEAFRRRFTNKILNEVSGLLEAGQLDEGEQKLRSLIPYESNATRIEDALKSFTLLRKQQTEAEQREVESQKKEEVGRMRKNVMSFMREAEFDKAESELRGILAVLPDEGLQRLLTDMPEVRRKHQASTEAANEVESLAKAQKSFDKAQELFATGRFDESAKLLRKTIALDPSNDRAAKLLRRAHEFDSLGTSPSAPKTKFDPYGQIVN